MFRRMYRDRTARRWLAAWLGGSVLGVTNGVIREVSYKQRLGKSAANQVSTATLVGLLAAYFWLLQRRWPIRTGQRAAEIGAAWVVLTVVFEFGFGHYVDRKSWPELLENYDLTEGNLWILVLLWIGAGPAALRVAAGHNA